MRGDWGAQSSSPAGSHSVRCSYCHIFEGRVAHEHSFGHSTTVSRCR
ncbi:hypothetical protein GJR98_11595 [Haloferax sp. MBLA0077]|uniref:Uncharacterized protein n=2 Tax=Haloferax TaxID=2251 RepID=A0A6G1Z4M6_9EURY|nr:hypothetical protein Hfx1149_11605 [Haloferax sp. CBA1149]MRW81351.1 hypothetical protein [Haloferax marinisediminis]